MLSQKEKLGKAHKQKHLKLDTEKIRENLAIFMNIAARYAKEVYIDDIDNYKNNGIPYDEIIYDNIEGEFKISLNNVSKITKRLGSIIKNYTLISIGNFKKIMTNALLRIQELRKKRIGLPSIDYNFILSINRHNRTMSKRNILPRYLMHYEGPEARKYKEETIDGYDGENGGNVIQHEGKWFWFKNSYDVQFYISNTPSFDEYIVAPQAPAIYRNKTLCVYYDGYNKSFIGKHINDAVNVNNWIDGQLLGITLTSKKKFDCWYYKNHDNGLLYVKTTSENDYRPCLNTKNITSSNIDCIEVNSFIRDGIERVERLVIRTKEECSFEIYYRDEQLIAREL